MSFIFDRIRAWRYGYTGITGLNEMQNQLKMLIIVLAPFLGMWYGVMYVVAAGYLPVEWLGPLQLVALIAWGMFCGLYYAKIRVDATQYKVCPQTPTYMPDGTEKKFTFKIEPEGLTKKCEFEDGSIGIHARFADRYLFHDKRKDFPFVFNDGYFKIPAEVGDSFDFMSEGEFWHGGMVVTTSNCEHISIYVRDFVEFPGNRFSPVGVIADCSHAHREFMKEKIIQNLQCPRCGGPINFQQGAISSICPYCGFTCRENNGDADVRKVELTEQDAFKMLFRAEFERNEQLNKDFQTLVQKIQVDQQHARNYKKSVRDGLSSILDAIHVWDELEEPLVKRIFTWKNIAYAAILFGGLFLFLYLIGVIKI